MTNPSSTITEFRLYPYSAIGDAKANKFDKQKSVSSLCTVPELRRDYIDQERSATAQLVAALVPGDDMRALLTDSQQQLTGVKDRLDATCRTIPDLTKSAKVYNEIARRLEINKPALKQIDTAVREKAPLTADLSTQTVEAIHPTLSLLASSLLTFRGRLATVSPESEHATLSEISGLAPILGTAERVRKFMAQNPIADLTASHHEMLASNLKILATAYAITQIPASSMGHDYDTSALRKAIEPTLAVYSPSEEMVRFMRRTFERVYGGSGLAETLAEIDQNWSRFSVAQKVVIANSYGNALWQSFNKELALNSIRPAEHGAPFPIVFDRDIQTDTPRALGRHLLGMSHYVPTTHSAGVIILNSSLANQESGFESLATVGHHVARGLLYYLLQNNITPPGCEHDMRWLGASLILSETRMFTVDPHEQIPRMLDREFATFFAPLPEQGGR